MHRFNIVAFIVLSMAGTILAFAGASAPSLKPHLLPGDRLVYDLTYELQEHQFPAPQSGLREVVHDSAGSGTETFVVRNVAADGTADVSDTIDFRLKVDNRSGGLHQTVNSVISSDGALLTVQLGESEVAKALDLANSVVDELSSHPPRLGEAWKTPVRISGIPALVQVSKTITGKQRYRGFSTLLVRSAGSASLRARPGGPAIGSASIAASMYYDTRDRLIIGQAYRGFMVFSSPARGGHINVTTTVSIALRSLGRGVAPTTVGPSKKPAAKTAPVTTPTSTPTPAPTTNPASPQPYPTTTGPQPYPTVSP